MQQGSRFHVLCPDLHIFSLYGSCYALQH